MTPETEAETVEGHVGPLRLPYDYCPLEPTVKQEWFLRRQEPEVFFGGAAGPGKSLGLLMAALQWVDVGEYHGLLIRPVLNEFEQPGGLIPIAADWLDGTDAVWNGTDREWRFPSGATVRFGYLAAQRDLRRYKGPSYSFCGFDELTSFPEWAYRAMFRVLRQARTTALEEVPLRMRSASNPGDIGHSWVKTRFVDPRSRELGVVFVRATIHDNPFLDYDAYVSTSLAHLSPVDRQRLIDGDWDVMEEGGKFDREMFQVLDEGEAPAARQMVRYWDLAATEPTSSNTDPDYTVGLLLSRDVDDEFTVRHVVRGRWKDSVVEATARAQAGVDGRSVPIYVEQEPGASGKLVVGYWRRDVLAGFAVHAGLTRGSNKEVRARPVAAAVGNGLVRVIRGENTQALLDECAIFPHGSHDDIVDALSGAHNALTSVRRVTGRVTSVPRGTLPDVTRRVRVPARSAYGR